ncbi:GPW/gp25 family protein [Ascidiaceihabitans sp.]|jgi:predicted component of type VI protein secretion system|nr:GPW/gp25 family protein [Ascidiaceihabitans sp.]|tara:strand:+ start:9447 stop:9851 length:405 start_codon:yes stop_codon:yes gene_type:complete
MSFATAFLKQSASATVEQRIAMQIEMLLQSISPERLAGSALSHVKASNLCFGLPMNWAVAGGARDTMIRQELQQRLKRFEPRINLLSEIEIQSDEQNNSISFYIVATVATESGSKKIAFEKTISRMDHNVRQGS